MGFFHVLKKRQLLILWLSQMLSAFGDHLFFIAITWLAVNEVGASAAYVIGVGTISSLVFGPIGGVFSDRWNRYVTMLNVDLIRAFVVFLIPILEWSIGIQLWHLIVIMIIVEGLGSFFDPAMQASLPILCESEETLLATNALMDSTRRFARIVGPGLTGLLLVFLSLPDFFTLDAITFAVSALSLVLIKRYFDAQNVSNRQAETDSTITSFKADVIEAIHLLRNHTILKWSLVSLGLVNFAWGIAYMVGASLFTKQVLMEDVGVYGLLGAMYGVGNIISLFIFGSGGRNISRMFVGQMILGIGFLIFAFSHSFLVASIGIVIAAFGSPIGDLILLTLIQTEFPSKHIGKIYSIRALIGGTGLSLGALVAGPLFSLLSIPIVIAACAIFIVCVGATGIVCLQVTKVRATTING